jgi:hypothetical protein
MLTSRPLNSQTRWGCTSNVRYRFADTDAQSNVQKDLIAPHAEYGPPQLDAFPVGAEARRDERRVRRQRRATTPEKEVGVNRVIRVVSACRWKDKGRRKNLKGGACGGVRDRGS